MLTHRSSVCLVVSQSFTYICVFSFKAAEKEMVRAKAEEEAQAKKKIANAERKAAKKIEQKKAKMEMRKRKVSIFSDCQRISEVVCFERFEEV